MTMSRSVWGVLVAGALFSGVATLQAHMKLEKSTPAANAVVSAPPAAIEVAFSEAPDLKVSRLTIKGPSAATTLAEPQVKANTLVAAVQGEMPNGAYTVSWQAAGRDGHIQKGDFTFTVKR